MFWRLHLRYFKCGETYRVVVSCTRALLEVLSLTYQRMHDRNGNLRGPFPQSLNLSGTWSHCFRATATIAWCMITHHSRPGRTGQQVRRCTTTLLVSQEPQGDHLAAPTALPAVEAVSYGVRLAGATYSSSHLRDLGFDQRILDRIKPIG